MCIGRPQSLQTPMRIKRPSRNISTSDISKLTWRLRLPPPSRRQRLQSYSDRVTVTVHLIDALLPVSDRLCGYSRVTVMGWTAPQSALMCQDGRCHNPSEGVMVTVHSIGCLTSRQPFVFGFGPRLRELR